MTRATNVSTVSARDEATTPLESSTWRGAVLAAVGGCVDAAGFLILVGLFTAHMSGNSTGLGVALATGNWEEAIRRGFVIPVYVIATLAGVAWIESQQGSAQRHRAIAHVLALEALCLLAFLILASQANGPLSLQTRTGSFVLTAVAATVAMGLQNSALRRVHATGVHTTFVTGMLTEVAVASVRWWIAKRRSEPDAIRNARQATLIAASIWSAYLVGAILGAALVYRLGPWALFLPIAALLGLLLTLNAPLDPADPESPLPPKPSPAEQHRD